MDQASTDEAPVPAESRLSASQAQGLSGATTLGLILVSAVSIGLLVFLTSWAAPLLAPLSLGLIIAALASPLFASLVRRGRSATIAMAITVLIVIILGAILVVFSLYSSRQLAESLALYATQLNSEYPQFAEALAALGVPGGLRDLISPEVLASILEAAASAISEVGGNLAFALVLAALLLLDGPRLAALFAQGIGSENPVFSKYPAVAQSAITYFVIRIRVNALTAAGLLVVMLVLGVDNPILWTIGAFFLSFVPYVGLVIAMIPPVILAFAESGPGAALVMIIAAAVLNVVAENVLEPSMTSKALKLSTWVVFIMFFFTVWLIGPVGALLAMPLTVLMVLVLQDNPRTQWTAKILTKR